MNAILRTVAVAGLLAALSACSKKQVASEEPIAEPAAPATTPATQPAPGPASSEQVRLESVTKALEQKNYTAAVDTLLLAKQQLSERDRALYHQQLRNTTDALMRAQRTDPQAAAAYERLTLAILGR